MGGYFMTQKINEKDMATADPKCPDCGVVGMNNIMSCDGAYWYVEISKSNVKPPFRIVFCGKCGHIYNAIPFPF